MGSEQKRAFLAVVLSALVLFSWQFFFAPKMPEAQKSPMTAQPLDKNAVQETPATTVSTGNQTQASLPVQAKSLELSGTRLDLGSDLSVHSMATKQSFMPFSEFMGTKDALKIQVITEQGTKDLNLSSNETSGSGSYTAQDPAPPRQRSV